VPPFYRESGNKKRWMSESSPGWRRVGAGVCAPSSESRQLTTAGLATGWRPYYVPGAERPQERLRMDRSMPKLLGFVVLAAIILATGFGAMG